MTTKSIKCYENNTKLVLLVSLLNGFLKN